MTESEVRGMRLAMSNEVEMLVVHHDDDTPENRAAAEKTLRAGGVKEVRHTTALDIFHDRVLLRSDGYARVSRPRRSPPHE